MRGLATPDADHHEESDEEEHRDNEPPRIISPDETAVWTVLRDTCRTCNPCPAPASSVCGAARPHSQRHAGRAG
eukprot:9440609-Pyramimonas_sp.AAC.1